MVKTGDTLNLIKEATSRTSRRSVLKGLAGWLKSVTRPREVPAGQASGPFSKGPRAYVICPYCTLSARQIDPLAHLQGVSKQHFRNHLVQVHGIEKQVAAGVNV